MVCARIQKLKLKQSKSTNIFINNHMCKKICVFYIFLIILICIMMFQHLLLRLVKIYYWDDKYKNRFSTLFKSVRDVLT